MPDASLALARVARQGGLYWAGSALARIIREDEGHPHPHPLPHEGEGEVWEPSPLEGERVRVRGRFGRRAPVRE